MASHDKTERLCVEAAYEVMSDEQGRIGVAHAGFAMTSLPHKKTVEPVWERDSGQITLLVESGLDSTKRAKAFHMDDGGHDRGAVLVVVENRIFIRSRSFRSISKHSGALISRD